MYLPNKVIKALSIIIQTFRKIGYCSDEFRDPIRLAPNKDLQLFK